MHSASQGRRRKRPSFQLESSRYFVQILQTIDCRGEIIAMLPGRASHMFLGAYYRGQGRLSSIRVRLCTRVRDCIRQYANLRALLCDPTIRRRRCAR